MMQQAHVKDPVHMCKVIGEAAKSKERRGDVEASKNYQEEVSRASVMRSQFNLEGLWIDK